MKAFPIVIACKCNFHRERDQTQEVSYKRILHSFYFLTADGAEKKIKLDMLSRRTILGPVFASAESPSPLPPPPPQHHTAYSKTPAIQYPTCSILYFKLERI